MKENLTIVKVGGKIVESEQSLKKLITLFKNIDGPKILVHGGGRSATRIAEDLGVKTRMVDGRRVTDEQMLKVVTMVYGGLVNKSIVAQLQSVGVNAMGLTGVDGNLIQAHKREVEEVDYGFVGDVDQVNTLLFSQLIYSNIVPVVAPLTHDKKGSILNTNADTIAGSCAIGLAKHFNVRLIYCFEKKGVLLNASDEESALDILTFPKFKELAQKGVIQGGMIPKLENSFDALKRGVHEVVITSFEYINSNIGTKIVLD